MGLEILNNIVFVFPAGLYTDRCLYKNVHYGLSFLFALAVSSCIEVSQLVFRIGLFEFDDIFNNVFGAIAGWCVFHVVKKYEKAKERIRSTSP